MTQPWLPAGVPDSIATRYAHTPPSVFTLPPPERAPETTADFLNTIALINPDQFCRQLQWHHRHRSPFHPRNTSAAIFATLAQHNKVPFDQAADLLTSILSGAPTRTDWYIHAEQEYVVPMAHLSSGKAGILVPLSQSVQAAIAAENPTAKDATSFDAAHLLDVHNALFHFSSTAILDQENAIVLPFSTSILATNKVVAARFASLSKLPAPIQQALAQGLLQMPSISYNAHTRFINTTDATNGVSYLPDATFASVDAVESLYAKLTTATSAASHFMTTMNAVGFVRVDDTEQPTRLSAHATAVDTYLVEGLPAIFRSPETAATPPDCFGHAIRTFVVRQITSRPFRIVCIETSPLANPFHPRITVPDPSLNPVAAQHLERYVSNLLPSTTTYHPIDNIVAALVALYVFSYQNTNKKTKSVRRVTEFFTPSLDPVVRRYVRRYLQDTEITLRGAAADVTK